MIEEPLPGSTALPLSLFDDGDRHDGRSGREIEYPSFGGFMSHRWYPQAWNVMSRVDESTCRA